MAHNFTVLFNGGMKYENVIFITNQIVYFPDLNFWRLTEYKFVFKPNMIMWHCRYMGKKIKLIFKHPVFLKKTLQLTLLYDLIMALIIQP